MTKEITTCDVCGVQKKETNHWFRADMTNRRFNVLPFNDVANGQLQVSDVCGEACLVKLLNKWLSVFATKAAEHDKHMKRIAKRVVDHAEAEAEKQQQ